METLAYELESGRERTEAETAPSIHILLIEDMPETARLIMDLLQETHVRRFEVECADHLVAGLDRLARGSIDLVMLDLSLADGAGLANVEQARALAPHIPIIVLSSLNDEAVAIMAVEEGAQDYLVRSQLDSHLLARAIVYAIDRKRAETELSAAERKYHSIFEHIVEGIFQTTPDGRYLNANPALARIYGYESPADLIAHVTDIGRSLYVRPGQRDKFIRLMDENDVVTNFESEIYRKDGSIIWIAENVRVIRDDKGKLVCYEGTVEDITARKRVEQKLQNSEALYHSLVETLPQNILRKDLSERFTFANQRFCLNLGRPIEDILGKTDFDFFPAEMAAKYQRDDRLIMETGKPFETVEEHQAPGGPKQYVQVVKTPLYDAEGKIIGLQGIFWDITEKKVAEERERRANEELARSREELRGKNEQMEEDLRMACEIQQAILPQQYPTFPLGSTPEASALGFCHRYHPTGAVGGDFFNVLALSDTTAGVFICDVMGHGVRSALVTAMVRALVEELKPVAEDPGQLLTQLNRDLRAILKQSGSLMFTTAFYLVIDLAKRELRYANAAHPKPLLLRRGAGVVETLANKGGKAGPALGLFDHSEYTGFQAPLAAGDAVMLFTDGVFEVEGADRKLYSQEMLIEAVNARAALPCSELFDALLVEIQSFAATGEFDDDVCLVGVEIR